MKRCGREKQSNLFIAPPRGQLGRRPARALTPQPGPSLPPLAKPPRSPPGALLTRSAVASLRLWQDRLKRSRVPARRVRSLNRAPVSLGACPAWSQAVDWCARCPGPAGPWWGAVRRRISTASETRRQARFSASARLGQPCTPQRPCWCAAAGGHGGVLAWSKSPAFTGRGISPRARIDWWAGASCKICVGSRAACTAPVALYLAWTGRRPGLLL